MLEKSKPLKNLQKREIKLENLLVIVIAEKQRNKDAFCNIYETRKNMGNYSLVVVVIGVIVIHNIDYEIHSR